MRQKSLNITQFLYHLPWTNFIWPFKNHSDHKDQPEKKKKNSKNHHEQIRSQVLEKLTMLNLFESSVLIVGWVFFLFISLSTHHWVWLSKIKATQDYFPGLKMLENLSIRQFQQVDSPKKNIWGSYVILSTPTKHFRFLPLYMYIQLQVPIYIWQ